MHAVKFYQRAAIALKPGGTLRIGGHPKWCNGILLAPAHFPHDKINFEWLDIMLEDTFSTKYTLTPPQHMVSNVPTLLNDDLHWEKWTAPKSPAVKQALNEHIQKQIQRQR